MTDRQPKETQPCGYCGGLMEKCGDGWYCLNPECGFNYAQVRSRPHPAPAADTSASQQRIEQIIKELRTRLSDARKASSISKAYAKTTSQISHKEEAAADKREVEILNKAIALLRGEQGGGSR